MQITPRHLQQSGKPNPVQMKHSRASGVSLSTARGIFSTLDEPGRRRETGLDEHGKIIIYQAELKENARCGKLTHLPTHSTKLACGTGGQRSPFHFANFPNILISHYVYPFNLF